MSDHKQLDTLRRNVSALEAKLGEARLKLTDVTAQLRTQHQLTAGLTHELAVEAQLRNRLAEECQRTATMHEHERARADVLWYTLERAVDSIAHWGSCASQKAREGGSFEQELTEIEKTLIENMSKGGDDAEAAGDDT